MKNNLLLATLILGVSCTNNSRFGKGEISLAEKRYFELNGHANTRGIAESNQDACATDEVTEDRLVQDIKALENNQVTGSRAIINGLDLSHFSPSESRYLEKNKSWIYTSNLNLSECSDVKCVFSKIYPNSNGYEGYINYYFYLKMGYALSTVNSIPGMNLGNNFSYQDVLFSKDELQGFYYLSKALGPAFQKIPTLSSIHRMPRKTTMPDYPNSCGLAGGMTNQGYIIFSDNCLVKTTPPKIGGYFYPVVTHELSHRVDYNILPRNAVFSESQTWLDMSGWYLKENVDTVTGKSTSRSWVHADASDTTKDGFIRDYAATNPGEDFADSVGYSRFTADDVARIAPRKYAWISKNLFNERSYTTDGLSNTYLKFLSDYGMNGLPYVINNCVANRKSSTYSLTPEQLHDYQAYEPELIQCIFEGIDNQLTVGIRELKINELEACSYFSSNASILKNKVMSQMNDFIKKDLNKNIEIGLQLKTLSEFISRLNEEVDPREIFIACQGDKSPVECFSKELKNSFEAISTDYTSKIPNQLNSFQETYAQENRYLEMKAKITALFSQIYAGSELRFKDEALRKWKICYEEKSGADTSEQEDVHLYPYNGGSQFIKKSLLNCLNRNAETELLATLDKVGNKLGITISGQSTKKFVLEMYLPVYTSTLQNLIGSEVVKETARIQERKNTVTNKVLNSLITDTTWVGTTARGHEELLNACEEQSKGLVQNELEVKNSDFTDLIFHSAADNIWQQGTCSIVVENNKIRSMNEMNQTNTVKKVLSNLDDELMTSIDASIIKCKKQFSSNSILVIKSRNLCLTNALTWNSAVNDALDAWISNEKISFISSARNKGKDYLENKKASLKDQAIKKMNAK